MSKCSAQKRSVCHINNECAHTCMHVCTHARMHTRTHPCAYTHQGSLPLTCGHRPEFLSVVLTSVAPFHSHAWWTVSTIWKQHHTAPSLCVMTRCNSLCMDYRHPKVYRYLAMHRLQISSSVYYRYLAVYGLQILGILWSLSPANPSTGSEQKQFMVTTRAIGDTCCQVSSSVISTFGWKTH